MAFSRKSSHKCSTGLSSGLCGGSGISLTFSGMMSVLDLCHPAWSTSMMTKKSLKVLSDFLEEKIHHFRICVGKDERSDLPQCHAYCGVYVYERSDDLSWRFWPHPPRSPAGSMLVDSPKSAFVLRHDRNRPTVLRVPLGHDFGYLLGEFFLKSSWACASAWT